MTTRTTAYASFGRKMLPECFGLIAEYYTPNIDHFKSLFASVIEELKCKFVQFNYECLRQRFLHFGVGERFLITTMRANTWSYGQIVLCKALNPEIPLQEYMRAPTIVIKFYFHTRVWNINIYSRDHGLNEIWVATISNDNIANIAAVFD